MMWGLAEAPKNWWLGRWKLSFFKGSLFRGHSLYHSSIWKGIGPESIIFSAFRCSMRPWAKQSRLNKRRRGLMLGFQVDLPKQPWNRPKRWHSLILLDGILMVKGLQLKGFLLLFFFSFLLVKKDFDANYISGLKLNMDFELVIFHF